MLERRCKVKMEALLPSNFTSNNIDQLSNATLEVVLNLQIKCFLIDPLVLYLCNEGCNSTGNPICYQVICHILAVIPNKLPPLRIAMMTLLWRS